MKFLFSFCLLLLFASLTKAQTPGGINYQGVARNQYLVGINNDTIGLKFRIRQNNPTGIILYSETRTARTDSFGVFSVVIGGAGASFQSGNFKQVPWSDTTKKFLEVELNVNDPNTPGFMNMGTTQLLSVPFSFYSDISDSTNFSKGSGKYFFSATKPNGSEPIPNDPNDDFNYILKFPTVKFNEGGAYNPVTSSYTAPDSGIYNFNLTLNLFYSHTAIIDTLPSYASIKLVIVKNNIAIKYFKQLGNLVINDLTHSHSFLVKLAKNDVISVRLAGYCDNGGNCSNLLLVTSVPTGFAESTAFAEFSGYKIK